MEFVGHKGAAFLDLWSISHFLLGVAMGGLPLYVLTVMRRIRMKPETISIDPLPYQANANIVVLLFALSWEVLEFGLEAGIAGEPIRFWLQGHEHWLNRLISDPLLLLIGYQLAIWRPQIVWPSRILIFVWGWTFLVALPHSMAYLD